MIAPQPLLSVRSLCKYFPIKGKGFFKKNIATVRAVDDVSFDLVPGETLGLVGESGCGKTTLSRSILRAIIPTSGQAILRIDGASYDLATLPGSRIKPLRRRMQMIFQDPFSSLNPRMTVGDIVGEPLKIHGLANASERKDMVADMLRKVGLNPDQINRYPHAFSGGQRQRIGIARALIMRPAFVVADEAVSALDVSVQAQVINLLKDLQAELNLTYIFVAHNLGVIKHICDRAAVMYAGRIVELAPTEEIFNDPKHPYTKGLISAAPSPDPDIKLNFKMSGEVADPAKLPSGCSFHPRCYACTDACQHHRPELTHLGDTEHYVACHLFSGIL
jgi:oligopeptide/dipeptide ABC transporter ATP-binding protein